MGTHRDCRSRPHKILPSLGDFAGDEHRSLIGFDRGAAKRTPIPADSCHRRALVGAVKYVIAARATDIAGGAEAFVPSTSQAATVECVSLSAVRRETLPAGRASDSSKTGGTSDRNERGRIYDFHEVLVPGR
jgi:hypothetical protein